MPERLTAISGDEVVWLSFPRSTSNRKAVYSRCSRKLISGVNHRTTTLAVRGDDTVFQNKLRSIEAHRSHLPIAALVESIRQNGPYEYLRDVHFRLYSSKKYHALFAVLVVQPNAKVTGRRPKSLEYGKRAVRRSG